MLSYLLSFAMVVFLVWGAARVFLRAPDHSPFDRPVVGFASGRTEPSPEIHEIRRLLEGLNAETRSLSRREQIAMLRRIMNEGILGAPVSADELGVRTQNVDAGGAPAEWVLAPGADSTRRLMYIHGGGFYAGSPTSARMLTAALAKLCGLAVLSIDYRLMPENRRLDSVSDCQNAYRYLIGHGPNGTEEAEQLFVAGDSAGGNLALMLSAWIRDAGLRPLDGVIAFSPSTDLTLAGDSFRNNVDTDPMLGPALAPLVRLPETLRLLVGLALSRANPRNPVISPLFGRLDNLPRTLIQASDCEMLIDDARRYVNKANAQGSQATLQIWPGMVHVFQMFGHVLPEAGEALNEVARFVAASAASDSSVGQEDAASFSSR